MSSTRMDRVRRADPVDEEWLRRLALLTVAFQKERAEEWLAGLGPDLQEGATRQARQFSALPRTQRQALLASEMGWRREAPEAVRDLCESLPERLVHEVRQRLPEFLAAAISSSPLPSAAPLPELTQRLARRLAHEATF